MAQKSETPIRVFVSYSHRDKQWLERLKVHLRPLVRENQIDLWDDTRLSAGTRWRDAIQQAVQSAEVAVLLISADFLASDFIAVDELPPLLDAAETRGARILSIIVSPSIFGKTPLARFQAVNDPARSVLSMSEAEQEAVFAKVAETVHDLQQHPRSPRSVAAAEAGGRGGQVQIAKGECFTSIEDWTQLVKIGNWVLDQRNDVIIGDNLHTYLLSRREYGTVPYQVAARLAFDRCAEHIAGSPAWVNAGIVLAWNADGPNPRYCNLLFTGERVLLERIGFKGGSVGRDYQHVDEGVQFKLEEGREYNFQLIVQPDRLRLSVDSDLLYEAATVQGAAGRVGLRPWRSQLRCSKFTVVEGG
jgi:hypothetical protein